MKELSDVKPTVGRKFPIRNIMPPITGTGSIGWNYSIFESNKLYYRLRIMDNYLGCATFITYLCLEDVLHPGKVIRTNLMPLLPACIIFINTDTKI